MKRALISMVLVYAGGCGTALLTLPDGTRFERTNYFQDLKVGKVSATKTPTGYTFTMENLDVNEQAAVNTGKMIDAFATFGATAFRATLAAPK